MFYIYQTNLSKATYKIFRLYIFCQYVCSLGIEPTTFALLMQYATTEPQEQLKKEWNVDLSTVSYIVACVVARVRTARYKRFQKKLRGSTTDKKPAHETIGQ